MKWTFLWGIILFFSARELRGEEEHTIYVASISWHTGIIVPAAALPDSMWPAQHDYSKADYLEIGWGDRDFFQHPGFNLWYAFKAIFWPTKTALHVLPLHGDNILSNYLNTTVVRLKISQESMDALSRFLVAHFELTDRGKAVPLKEGFYYTSQFFAGSAKYYFPKNSNVWAARALKCAGFPLTPIFYQTTGLVVNKAARFGEVVVEDD